MKSVQGSSEPPPTPDTPSPPLWPRPSIHSTRVSLTSHISSKPPPPADTGNKKGGSLRLDDWVLCRIYKKNNSQRPVDQGDKEDSMEGMFATLQNSSHHNPEPPSASNHIAYASLLGDGMQNGSISHQLPSSSSKPNMSMTSVSTNTLPAARTLPPHRYWNDSTGSPVGLANSSGKRFHGELNAGISGTQEDSTSFVSMLNQLPQSTPSVHPSTLLDGVLRQPFQLSSLNWNS
ncbi:hypothetical protein OIU78_000276 [Salix suchowensis]|nr:hypothetical protein OIU78_000276 [Salix suchowensis]